MREIKNPISIFHDLKMIRPPSPYWPESANVYLFTDQDGISLFDVGCGSNASAERLLGALKVLEWESKPVKKIILSHAHPDHMGAMTILLSEITPESIILHEIDVPYALDPERLMLSFDIPLCKKRTAGRKTDRLEEGKGADFDLLEFFRAAGCSMCRVEPTETVTEGDVIEIGDYHLEVIHTPGHAPGHVSLYDRKRRILLAGDILGETLAWYAPSSGGATGYMESLKKISLLDIDLVLPSHGHVMEDSKGAIRATMDKLEGKEKIILDALKQGGKTFEELLEIFFVTPSRQFFPGIPIMESHLQKLENDMIIVTTSGSRFNVRGR